MREGLDYMEAKLLALVAFGDGNILDLTDTAETAEELVVDEDGTYSNDLVTRLVEDDDGEVRVRGCTHDVELIDPRCLAEVIDRQNGKDIEMSAPVVC